VNRSDKTDRILAVSAIVSAIAAVVVAAYEARINREYQRISVWPYVGQGNSGGRSSDAYERSVYSSGIGPALIRSVQVSVDGVVRQTWGDVAKALIGKRAEGAVYSSLHAGSVILAGRDVKVFQIPAGEEAAKFWEEVQGPRLHIVIGYESLYGEKWVSDSAESEPRRVSHFDIDPAKEFQE